MIDWVPKCRTHQQPCLRVDSAQLVLKCDQCSHNALDHPIAQWMENITRTATESVRFHRSCLEILGKLDGIQTSCANSLGMIRSLRSDKFRLGDLFKQLKTALISKLDALQDSCESIIEEQLQTYESDTTYCSQVIKDLNQCQLSYALQHSNNIQIILQQHNDLTQVQQLVDTLVNIQSQDKRNLLTKFKQASQRIQEFEAQPSFLPKDSSETIAGRIMDMLQAQIPIKRRALLQQQRPQSPSPMNKENNYFSHNPSLALGPSSVGTPLASNRALQKQHSMPTEKSLSKSPNSRRISPSPLRSIQSTFTIGTSNGNKTLLINQERKQLNPLELVIKPLKKYQIDFPVGAVEVITENIFAMSCTNDPYLRIFDTTQKRIHTLQSHLYPISAIEKTHGITVKSALQKPKHLVTLSLDSIVIWVFETVSGGPLQPVPQILHRFKCQDNIRSIAYCQDGSTVVMGDSTGNLSLYNFSSQKLMGSIERQHYKAITHVQFLGRQKKIIVFSEDQYVSVWKVLSKPVGETLILEIPAFQVQFGVIRTVNQLNNIELMLLGNADGQLKILNLMTQKIECESPTSVPIVDILVSEDHIDESSFCAIGLCQNVKHLRMWKFVSSEGVFVTTESKVDVAMTVGDNVSKSKLQFVQLYNGSHYILMANENGKELLVYEISSK